VTTVERLQGALNGLGLKAIEARLEGLLEQAAKKDPSYADFLDHLLGCEVEARRGICALVCNWRICPFSRPSISSSLGFSPPSTNGKSGS
jgi:hypothetical protein